MAEDCCGDSRERKYLLHCPARDGFLRHPEHDAGGLVLRQGDGPRISHLQEPVGSVGAHSRHDHADGVGTRGLGD